MPGIYSVTIGGVDGNGNYAENVSHWQHPEEGTHDAYHYANELATAFHTTITPLLAAIMATDCLLNLLSAKKVDGTGGPSSVVAENTSGSNAGTSQSLAQALDIAFFPGGTLNRAGHWFVWGIQAGGFLSGLPQAVITTPAAAFAIGLLAGLPMLSGGNAQFGTYTRKSKTITVATDFDIRQKATGMNKRTLPLT